MRADNLSFGVEIECYVPTDEQQRNIPVIGGYHHGSPIPEWGEWNAQADSSIRIHQPAGYTAVEVVSPILTGEGGLQDAYDMLNWLDSMGMRVDSHCGLHVHIDARHLTDEQIERVLHAWVRYEMAFYGLSGEKAKGRINSSYCQPARNWYGVTNGRSSRYQSLNLTNLVHQQKRTIEIRVWAGTTNPEQLATAIQMAVTLVARAADEDTTAEPIPTCREAAREFGSWIQEPEYCIIPECTNEDMAAMMLQLARRADRAISRQAA